jgi:hypothetical protein
LFGLSTDPGDWLNLILLDDISLRLDALLHVREEGVHLFTDLERQLPTRGCHLREIGVSPLSLLIFHRLGKDVFPLEEGFYDWVCTELDLR